MAISIREISSVETTIYADLQACFDDDSTTERRTLYINKIETLAKNTTQPTNFELVFVGIGRIVTNGYTYTCNGTHNYTDYHIWDTSLGGSVVYGSTSQMAYISSIWFGTRTGANVALACTAGGGRRVVLTGGTYAFSAIANLSSAPIEPMPGCYIIISSGCAPTNVKIFGNPNYQIFSCALADVPIFIANSIQFANSIWFGALDKTLAACALNQVLFFDTSDGNQFKIKDTTGNIYRIPLINDSEV